MMFDIPGVEPRSMSDDELLMRQQELQRRLSFAARFGMQSEATAQMQAMLASIDFARRERLLRDVYEQKNAVLPIVIETDPSMRPQEAPVEKKVRLSPLQRSRRPVATPVPTATPQEDTR